LRFPVVLPRGRLFFSTQFH